MKKVIAFGTFDIFHKGHEDYLGQARKFGDFLLVVVARDKNVEKIKGHLPENDENQRIKEVEKSGLADKVLLGDLHDRYKVIREFEPDTICLGYDQKVDLDELLQKLLEFGLKDVKIKRLEPFMPEVYKSSRLKGNK